MRTEIIVYRHLVTSLHQQVSFQMSIPSDATKITGVETGAFRVAGFDSNPALHDPYSSQPIIEPRLDVLPEFLINATQRIGQLTLRAGSDPDVFYQGEVRQHDSGGKFGDFTVFPPVFGQWSHGYNWGLTDVEVDHPTIIEGVYQNTWNTLKPSHEIHWLQVYIWFEKN